MRKLSLALLLMLLVAFNNIGFSQEKNFTIDKLSIEGRADFDYFNENESSTSGIDGKYFNFEMKGSFLQDFSYRVRQRIDMYAGSSKTDFMILSYHANKNWSLYNSEAMAGAIKSITITQTATGTNKFQNQMYVSLGTTTQGAVTAITNAQQHTSLDANTITFDIDPSKGYTYFKLLSTKKSKF